MHVSRNQSQLLNNWPFKDRSTWFEDIEKLLKRPKREIHYKKFYKKSDNTTFAIPNRFDLIFKYLNSNLLLVGSLEGPLLRKNEKLKQLDNSYNTIKTLLNDLKLENFLNIDVKILNINIVKMLDLLNPDLEAHYLISKSMIEDILENDSAWEALYIDIDLDYLKVIKLKSELGNIKEALNLLRP